MSFWDQFKFFEDFFEDFLKIDLVDFGSFLIVNKFY